MKSTRVALMIASVLVVVLLVGGGLAVRVGAADNPYSQVMLFSEVLSLVSDNYVDPVEADVLVQGAYEGLMNGLDARGAFLQPDEVAEWREVPEGPLGGPGVTVLKAYASLQVVQVEDGSPADRAGIRPGDQIRKVDDRDVRTLSLDQALRLIEGEVGSTVTLDLVHSDDGFKREVLELDRVVPGGAPYELEVERGVAVLGVRDLARITVERLKSDLDDVRSRGVERLLIDLRNSAAANPRAASGLAGLFLSGEVFRLRDRAGAVLESVRASGTADGWQGPVAVLVNGASAGGSEALAQLLQAHDVAMVYGESTYGLGTEPKLFVLPDGSGVLMPAHLWELATGQTWNDSGVQPDEVVEPTGRSIEARQQDQFEKTLELFSGVETETVPADRKAA